MRRIITIQFTAASAVDTAVVVVVDGSASTITAVMHLLPLWLRAVRVRMPFNERARNKKTQNFILNSIKSVSDRFEASVFVLLSLADSPPFSYSFVWTFSYHTRTHNRKQLRPLVLGRLAPYPFTKF